MSKRIFATVDGQKIEITERERVLASVASTSLRMTTNYYQDTERLKCALIDRVPDFKYASHETLLRLTQQLAGETSPLTILE